MTAEEIQVKFIGPDSIGFSEVVQLFDEDPLNRENVLIRTTCLGDCIVCSEENYFEALLCLRKQLEEKGVQICCLGAGENIYPSQMQQSMGTGRVANTLVLGERPTKDGYVDIFTYSPTVKYVSVKDQLSFFNRWVDSIRNGA